uniref:C2H2-type domain-containing protein n=1 Tax=Mesocestoides corti TaxID=53468 RepID=A0A5K3EWY9_MESCO
MLDGGITASRGLPFFCSAPLHGNSQASLFPFPPEAFQLSSNIAQCPITPKDYIPLLDLYSRSQISSTSVEQSELLKKFSSFHECGNPHCRTAGHREHFHCTHCEKVINRREETIRHLKWHKKREESLQFGFMRYSPGDDCGVSSCTHNMKQTHYHCLRPNCSKIYISTSDVQMHANYHRKDAVILQEGFQRFRAAEDCGSNDCPFSSERTTHFHCRRPGCNFTFKNKADMEKHKNHHQKNDAIAKDGFRKYTKSEHCKYLGCKYSGIMNHIHCIRPGCDYIVHSASQISSHKRKHERRELLTFPSPVASQPHQITPTSFENGSDVTTTPSTTTTTPKLSPQPGSPLVDPQTITSTARILQRVTKISEVCWHKFQNPGFKHLHDDVDTETADEVLQDVLPSLKVFKDGQSCDSQQCSLNGTDMEHFHCYRTGCMDVVDADANEEETHGGSAVECPTLSSGDMDAWREHWFTHAWQSTLAVIGYSRCSGGSCGLGVAGKDHLHCYLWPNCTFTAEVSSTPPSLMRHLARHDHHFAAVQVKEQATSLPVEPGATQRKRGRPPKHSRDIHVPRLEVSPDKCADPTPHVELTMEDFLTNKPDMIAGGAKFYQSDGPACVDRCCPFHAGRQAHFHCIRPRCHMATASLFVLNTHRREFHAQVTIEPGYDYFDRSIDCRRPSCYAKKDTNHFHCLRLRCGYSFVRVGKMQQHTALHEGGGGGGGGGGGSVVEARSLNHALPLFPPLGMGRDGTVPDLVPFLVNFIRGQLGPIKMDSTNSTTTTTTTELESYEEKMEWTESAAAAEMSILEANNKSPDETEEEDGKKSASPSEPPEELWAPSAQ